MILRKTAVERYGFDLADDLPAVVPAFGLRFDCSSGAALRLNARDEPCIFTFTVAAGPRLSIAVS